MRILLLALAVLPACTPASSVRVATARMQLQEAAYRAVGLAEGEPWPWEIHGAWCSCSWCKQEREQR